MGHNFDSSFLNTYSDKTVGHAKILEPILPLFVPTINIKKGEIFDSLCISHPWIKSKISHLPTSSPSHLIHLNPTTHYISHIFVTSPLSHFSHIVNLTILPPF